jgi:hypothetical protein
MKDRVRDIAKKAISGARLMEALWYFVLTSAFLLAALWLVFSFENGFAYGIAIVCGLTGAGLLLKASEAYVRASPPERPDERLRYLQSRSLYVPDNNQRSRRRERNDR